MAKEQMDAMGTLNNPWGVCGFTSSLYALYENSPTLRGDLTSGAKVSTRVVAEIKSFLIQLEADGNSKTLAEIASFTSYLPGDGKERDPVPLVASYTASTVCAEEFGPMVKLEALPEGGLAFDKDFLLECDDYRLHQVRLEGGDSSSDSYWLRRYFCSTFSMWAVRSDSRCSMWVASVQIRLVTKSSS